jgi:hypothetical protein
MSRNLDDLVTSTEHAEPVHPFRALVQHHFYLDDLVSTEGGLWLLMMDALLIVPLIMAAFFYPLQVLAATVAVLLASLVAYEAYVIWRRRHPHLRT